MTVSLTFLTLCIGTLFLGPILHPFTNRSRNFFNFLDGFVLTSVLALVFFHILPHTVEDGGGLAFVMLLIGLLLPNLFEKWGSKIAKATHRTALFLAIIGLALHMFMDGLILVQPQLLHQDSVSHQSILPLAVFVHRIPMALMIWWILKNHMSKTLSLLILFFMGFATIAGYFFGVHIFDEPSSQAFSLFEALVAGSLLHVIFHYHNPHGRHQKGWNWSAGLGCLLAIAFGFFINSFLPLFGHSHAWEHISENFLILALESAPALVIAYFAGGAIQVFLPKASVLWLQKGRSASQSLKGMIFGLPLPVCSCGVVPLYRSLVKRGTPVAAATAFFIATPELGLDAILISLPLLGKEMMIFRIVAAALVAFSVGLIIGIWFKNKTTTTTTDTNEFSGLSFFQKIKESLKSSFGEIVDHTGPWILVGLLIAAILKPVLETNSLANVLPLWQVPLFAVLGMPVYVCAAGATPLVAVLLASFVSPGAALAFLLTGPATNITTFGILSDLHGKKMALSFAVLVVSFSVACGYFVNFFFPEITIPNVFNEHTHNAPFYQILSLWFLAAVLLSLILRKGPRHLVNQIISFEHHDHDHNHDAIQPSPEKGCCS